MNILIEGQVVANPGFKAYIIQVWDVFNLFCLDPVSLQPGVFDGLPVAVGRCAQNDWLVLPLVLNPEDDAFQASLVSGANLSPS